MTTLTAFLPRLAAASFVALAASATGCAASSESANAPPVIDDLQVPETATIGKSGNYEISGKFTAHDADGTLVTAKVVIPGFVAPSIDAQHRARIDEVPFQLQIDGRAAKGPLDCTFEITDDDGATTSRSVTITLQ